MKDGRSWSAIPPLQLLPVGRDMDKVETGLLAALVVFTVVLVIMMGVMIGIMFTFLTVR